MESILNKRGLQKFSELLKGWVEEKLALKDERLTLLERQVITCPHTGRFGRRYDISNPILTGGAAIVGMSENWNNVLAGVFTANGALGVHTNVTFWNVNIITNGTTVSGSAIRRVGNDINVFPRYTGGTTGNGVNISRGVTSVSFFMASDELHTEIGGRT